MAPRKGFANLNVSEEFRIHTEKILRSFIDNSDEDCMQFPLTLSNNERAWIHKHCRTIGLESKSVGKEPKRFITVSKKNMRKTGHCEIPLKISQENINIVQDFIKNHPVTKEKNNSMKFKEKNIYVDNNMGQLTYGTLQVPSLSFNSDLIEFRKSLPIWSQRVDIMQMIVSHQVNIVCGETGSGKTTQLPQFILDYSSSCNERCRIICTQPRRISAVAVSERVAIERNERIGQTVGFHIRLESSVGPKTALIYCTNGILLRTLMNGDACLKTFTHIIVDEIHERDRYSDFLLICLRECLIHHPHLRLILMSATMDISLFQKYFNQASLIFIPGRLYPVQDYYLDDILQMINYESPAMVSKKSKFDKVQAKNSSKVVSQIPRSSVNEDVMNPIENRCNIDVEVDECIEECFTSGSEESFNQFLQLFLSEHVPVNYQHSENGCTALMAASFHGNLDIVQQLLTFGATPDILSYDNSKAIDYALMGGKMNIVEILQLYQNNSPTYNVSENDAAKHLTDLYTSTVSNDSPIDFDLLHAVLYFIHSTYEDFGSILVFLPGYDDIVITRDRINGDNRFNSIPYQTFTLHGSMLMSEQHKVFNPVKNKRKIILSTNIAETSITINDVLYVVDCGKVKEMTYDAIVGVSSLQSTWISQACAKQRAGRAGRTQPGICYHLYTKYRYMQMNDFATPEILRMPLHELCLQTKMLAPKDMQIAEFLARALEPPSAMAVQSAISHLQEIEALDANEDLTPLGNHLVDLPVEPRLGKMLIYAVIFKCLDPVLTIVSTLAYRDPFLLPRFSSQKTQAEQMKRTLASNTFSDHMILLRAFQMWQDARHSKSERAFCNKYFISGATMEMIVDIRSQLLAQLRATGFVKTRPPGDIRELNLHSNNWALIKAVLTTGFYPNIAYIDKNTAQIRTKNEKKIMLHHLSSLREYNSKDHAQNVRKIVSDWLIYEELSRSGIHYNIKSVTNISPLTVALFLDINNLNSTYSTAVVDGHSNSELILNNWIDFEAHSQIIKLVVELRQRISNLVTKKIVQPIKQQLVHDNELVYLISGLLSREDSSLGLFQPSGIGQRPKTFLINNYPIVNDIFKDSNKKIHHKTINQSIPEELIFEPVSSKIYNRYLPHFVNDKLENQSEIEKQQNYPRIDNSVQPHCFYTNETFHDESFLSQRLLLSNLYNPVNTHKNQNAYLQNDFDLNGITVSDDDSCGARALPPQQVDNIASLVDNMMLYDNVSPMDNIVQNVMPYSRDLITAFDPVKTCFFVIKSGGMKSIDISISKKTWIFSPQTERKLLRLLQCGITVIMIFTVQGTNIFQGIAKLLGGPVMTESDNSSQSDLACPIEWLSRADINYCEVKHLFTPVCLDGLELTPAVGVQLYLMFTNYQPKAPIQNEPLEIPCGRAIRGVKQY